MNGLQMSTFHSIWFKEKKKINDGLLSNKEFVLEYGISGNLILRKQRVLQSYKEKCHYILDSNIY